MSPRVSVVMVTHNRAQLVCRVSSRRESRGPRLRTSRSDAPAHLIDVGFVAVAEWPGDPVVLGDEHIAGPLDVRDHARQHVGRGIVQVLTVS